MSSTTTNSFIPGWLWAIACIEIIVPTYFGLATIIDPSLWGAEELGAIGQLYVTRNFTMALAVGLALVFRSRIALLIAIAARYLTDLVDIAAGFARGPDAETMTVFAVFTVVLLIIPAFGLAWLARNRETAQ